MTKMQSPKIETRLFIDGELCASSDGKTFPLVSPFSQELVAEVSEATAQDVDRAVEAAKKAFPAWSALSPAERGKPMKRLAALIREHHSELARLEALSMGRPITQYPDSFMCAEEFDHFAVTGYEAQGVSSLNTAGYISMTLRQPYGVVGAIIPWNLPLAFFGMKVAPAIAAGNTVILKSSEKAPLTSAKVASLINEAGFPPGVINVISGHGQVSGSAISHHMDIRALSFTGSGRTGRALQIASAKSNLKNLNLELGGKSPAIIFDDCDLEKAAQDTQSSIKWNSGQVCMAISRVYVQETVADRFISAFKEKFGAVSMGDPTDNSSNHGPQADRAQYESVLKYIKTGKTSGTLVLGGKPLESGNGLFIEPTVFTNTPEDAPIMKEETFGAIVNINTFKSEEEVMAKANDTEFGLYASVYTKDIDRAMRFAKGLESGYVGINCTSPQKGTDMPFGGYKSSGVGREGHKHTLDFFLETKTVLIKVGS